MKKCRIPTCVPTCVHGGWRSRLKDISRPARRNPANEGAARPPRFVGERAIPADVMSSPARTDRPEVRARPAFMTTTVVITGASAGVGRAVALEFARQGCNVALMARGVERLTSAARQAEAFGVTVLAIPVDVADPAALDAAAERVETELGPIDIWINNAMATIFAPVCAIRSDEFRRVTEVT